MKKNIVKYVLAVAVVAVAGMGVYQSQNRGIELSGVSLANVEALASGEGYNWLCPNGCMGTGDDCYCNGWYPYSREAGSNF